VPPYFLRGFLECFLNETFAVFRASRKTEARFGRPPTPRAVSIVGRGTGCPLSVKSGHVRPN
jgi:hypothetical protein